ncbi:MAG TPA: alginate lyase family protein [Mariniphaga sp.]|nr:alginate lyase family protein [Mariniphaga sp.]
MYYLSALSTATGQRFNSNSELLLSRINLNAPGLENVKELQDNAEEATRALLKYYKHRISVKHPIERSLRRDDIRNVASAKDIEVAENALKHIFVGQPAYPPHFCGEDINWNTRPVPDMEWVWQLNRMSFWESMGRAYWQTGDEKYAREWAAQLIDWTLKNPNDEEHKYAWRSIEAGIRGYRWTGIFQRFIDSPSFTPEVLVAFLNSCYDHAEYLMTKYTTRSNWGLMEAEGMAFIAMTFPEFADAEKWRNEAFRRLNNEINIQVYPDGHQRELAMGYHLGCIGWFMRTYELARLNGIEDAFPVSYLDRIEKMCEVPLKLGLPNGTNVQFGDAWEGSPGQHKRRFLEWADFYEREDFMYLATDGQEGNQPDSTAYAFPYSGLYSMRSGWNEDAICMVLKCGPDGGAHSQPDNGTFDVYAGGRNLMPDAGSYIYSGNPEGRAWFRQTKVHQTLTLDGLNSKYDPQLLLWQPGDSLDILVVENGSYDNLSHRRAILFIDNKFFVVIDEAIGHATGNVAIHFQLAPNISGPVYNRNEFSVTSTHPDGWNVHVRAQKQPGLDLEEEEGWVSYVYTKKEKRPAFGFHLQKENENKNLRFITLVAPFEQKIPDVKVRLLEDSEPGASHYMLEVEHDGKKQQISYKL